MLKSVEVIPQSDESFIQLLVNRYIAVIYIYGKGSMDWHIESENHDDIQEAEKIVTELADQLIQLQKEQDDREKTL